MTQTIVDPVAFGIAFAAAWDAAHGVQSKVTVSKPTIAPRTVKAGGSKYHPTAANKMPTATVKAVTAISAPVKPLVKHLSIPMWVKNPGTIAEWLNNPTHYVELWLNERKHGVQTPRSLSAHAGRSLTSMTDLEIIQNMLAQQRG